jgi:hypothetical protein
MPPPPPSTSPECDDDDDDDDDDASTWDCLLAWLTLTVELLDDDRDRHQQATMAAGEDDAMMTIAFPGMEESSGGAPIQMLVADWEWEGMMINCIRRGAAAAAAAVAPNNNATGNDNNDDGVLRRMLFDSSGAPAA